MIDERGTNSGRPQSQIWWKWAKTVLGWLDGQINGVEEIKVGKRVSQGEKWIQADKGGYLSQQSASQQNKVNVQVAKEVTEERNERKDKGNGLMNKRRGSNRRMQRGGKLTQEERMGDWGLKEWRWWWRICWKRKTSERQRSDERGHGLVESYNSRWALYVAALQSSDVFLSLIYDVIKPRPYWWAIQLTLWAINCAV